MWPFNNNNHNNNNHNNNNHNDNNGLPPMDGFGSNIDEYSAPFLPLYSGGLPFPTGSAFNSSALIQPGMPPFTHPLYDSGPDAAGNMIPGQSGETGSKPHIDPRTAAAELKERLLRSKSQRNSRDNSLGPPNEAAHGAQIQNDKKSLSSLQTHNLAAQSTPAFVPHPLPQQPPQNSLPADGDDIAALITSISSGAPDLNPESAMPRENKPGQLSNSGPPQPQHSGQATPQTPANKPVRGVLSSERPARFAIEEGEIGSPRKPILGGISSEQPASSQKPSPGQVQVLRRADSGSSSTMKKTHSSPTDLQGPKLTSSSLSHAQDDTRRNEAEAPKARELIPADVYYRPSVAGSARESTDKNRTKPIEQPHDTNKPNEQRGSDVGQAVDISLELSKLLEHDSDLRDWLVLTQYFDIEARTKKLTRHRKLAEMEAEERRIEAEQQRLALERRKLLAEDELERGIFQYNTLAVPTPQSLVSPTPVSSNPPELSNISIVQPATVSLEVLEQTVTRPLTMAVKRDFDERGSTEQHRAEKKPKLGNQENRTDDDKVISEDSRIRADRDRDQESRPKSSHGSRPKDAELRTAPSGRNSPVPRRSSQHSPHTSGRQRSPGPHRDSSPRRPSQNIPQGPRTRSGFDDHDEHSQQPYRLDRYRGGGQRGGRQRSPSPWTRREMHSSREPRPINMGRRGETRFFIVKSFNEDNVRRCMEDGIWTTQTQNGEVLTSAFAKCKNVILFFSINKSRAFQGYARMATAPSPDTPRPKWMNGIHWETTPPFRVEWLCRTEVEFFHIGHLRNPLNENLPVLVGKDGQEIEEECGRQLLTEMEVIVQMKNDIIPSSSNNRGDHHQERRDPMRSASGSGWGRGRGHSHGGHNHYSRGASRGAGGNKHHIKREEDDDSRQRW